MHILPKEYDAATKEGLIPDFYRINPFLGSKRGILAREEYSDGRKEAIQLSTMDIDYEWIPIGHLISLNHAEIFSVDGETGSPVINRHTEGPTWIEIRYQEPRQGRVYAFPLETPKGCRLYSVNSKRNGQRLADLVGLNPWDVILGHGWHFELDGFGRGTFFHYEKPERGARSHGYSGEISLS